MNRIHRHNGQGGFTLLLAIVVAGIVLAVGLTLLSISLKQFKISGISENSEKSFQAANAGIECIRFWDISSEEGDQFDVPSNGRQSSPAQINCMGSTVTEENRRGRGNGARSGDEQHFEFSWDNTGTPDTVDDLCTRVSVWKFYEAEGADGNDVGDLMTAAGVNERCPEGAECTIIRSRGYNRSCSALDSIRTVERELFMRY